MQQEIIQLKTEIIKSRETESKLLKVIEEMKVNQIPKEPNLKDDVYIIGSSILREVRRDDIVNGTVKSISGGKIKDIKQEIESLTIKPRTIVTQIGGNDVDSAGSSVEDVVSEYVMTLTDTKAKYPDTKLVVAGLPPRHNSTETRTKVKDYNDEMNKWCKANSVEFIDNESMFEFKTGEVDTSSYIMTGATPAIHLTRSATIRMMENIQKVVPSMILSDKRNQTAPEKKTYASVASTRPRHITQNQRLMAPRSHHKHTQWTDKSQNQMQPQIYCWFCGVPGHKKDICRHQAPIRCHFCRELGHKMKYCSNKEQ